MCGKVYGLRACPRRSTYINERVNNSMSYVGVYFTLLDTTRPGYSGRCGLE